MIFDSHVKSLCKKTSQKLKPLSRVPCQLDFNQRKLLLNAFITSQFTYVPVAWMFHSCKQNHCISRIHERDLQKSVEEILMAKMYLAPEIMKKVFEIKECAYVLRNKLKLKSRKIHSVNYSIYCSR